MNWDKEKDIWQEHLEKIKHKRYFCNVLVGGERKNLGEIDYWAAKETALRILSSEKDSILYLEVLEDKNEAAS